MDDHQLAIDDAVIDQVRETHERKHPNAGMSVSRPNPGNLANSRLVDRILRMTAVAARWSYCAM
jgi:hypothetical protein